ncbi:hypothetical protein D3C80_1608460 [compost metagenome]
MRSPGRNDPRWNAAIIVDRWRYDLPVQGVINLLAITVEISSQKIADSTGIRQFPNICTSGQAVSNLKRFR